MIIQFLQTAMDALSLGSIYALTALGIGLIFSVMRLVNFAHGDYISFCAFAMLLPAGEGMARVFIGGLPFWLLVPTVLLIGVMLALGSEVFLYRMLRGSDPATMMIASFGLGRAVQSLLLMVYGSRPIAINLWAELTQPLALGAVRIPVLQVVILIATAVALSALVGFLQLTNLGMAMRASSENFQMAQMLGVRANRVILAAFGVSGGLAALTALMVLPQTGVADIRMGQPILLVAFIATVIGGLGSLTGAVFTGLIIGCISVALQVTLPIEARPYRDAFVFVVVIAILLVRPQGLFAPRSHRGRI
jgi:branched-chain amino acid transport system permease protein